MSKKQTGFSFIEILLTLCLISIVIGISFPNLRELFFRTQNEILRAQLIDAIRLAQKEADVRRVPIALRGQAHAGSDSFEWSNGQLIFINEKADGRVQNEADILLLLPARKVNGKLYWRAFPHYRKFLLFSHTMNLSQDNGTFWFCNLQNKIVWAITLNHAGRERVLYPDKNGVIKDSHGKVLNCIN